MEPVYRPFDRRTDPAPVAGNAQQEVVISATEQVKILVHAVLVKRTSGAAVGTNQPRIYLVAGDAADAASERWRAAAATAAGSLINTTGINRPLTTVKFPAGSADAGKYGFYFIIDGDVLNAFTYEIFYEVLH